MKKILSVLLATAMLCGIFALGTIAVEWPHVIAQNEHFELLSEDLGDAQLHARGEALLRETLNKLSREWTIHGYGSVLSFNGELFASTWGIQRSVQLFGEGVHYTFNRNFRIRFDHAPTQDSSFTQQLLLLVNFNIDTLDFHVREHRIHPDAPLATMVDFEAGGFEFTFFYDYDVLRTIWMATRTEWGRNVNSIHFVSFEPTAQQNLFNTRFTLRLPAALRQPIMFVLSPITLAFTIFWNIFG